MEEDAVISYLKEQTELLLLEGLRDLEQSVMEKMPKDQLDLLQTISELYGSRQLNLAQLGTQAYKSIRHYQEALLASQTIHQRITSKIAETDRCLSEKQEGLAQLSEELESLNREVRGLEENVECVKVETQQIKHYYEELSWALSRATTMDETQDSNRYGGCKREGRRQTVVQRQQIENEQFKGLRSGLMGQIQQSRKALLERDNCIFELDEKRLQESEKLEDMIFQMEDCNHKTRQLAANLMDIVKENQMLRRKRQELQERRQVILEEVDEGDKVERLSIYSSKEVKRSCKEQDESESDREEDTIADILANNSSKPVLSQLQTVDTEFSLFNSPASSYERIIPLSSLHKTHSKVAQTTKLQQKLLLCGNCSKKPGILGRIFEWLSSRFVVERIKRKSKGDTRLILQL